MADKNPAKTAAEAAALVHTRCRVKCFVNGVLYNPGDPGPVFSGSIPASLSAGPGQPFFVKAQS